MAASINVAIDDEVMTSFSLYLDKPGLLLGHAEWMRRGAIYSLTQRAFTSAHRVHLFVADNVVKRIAITNVHPESAASFSCLFFADNVVQRIQIFKSLVFYQF